MITEFLTVDGEATAITVVNRSKFICYIKGIKNEAEAKEYVLSIKKQNSLAKHNCYAYIADDAGFVLKFSDDGEPQGTAGLPMLEVLKGRSLRRVVAVVTRYFGGIKLGTGGLARAYSDAVGEALNSSKITKFCLSDIFSFYLSYADYQAFLGCLDRENCKVISTDFGDYVKICVSVKINCSRQFINKVTDVFCGNIKYIKESEDFFAF